MSLRDDILALTATLSRLSRARDTATASDCTETRVDDTISAVSVAAEDDETRDNTAPSLMCMPVPRSGGRKMEEDTFTILPNSRDTTALPRGEATADRCCASNDNARSKRLSTPSGQEVAVSQRPPLAPTEGVTWNHSHGRSSIADDETNSCIDPVSSESCGVSTEPSGAEPSPCQVEEAYKRIARRLLSEIQRLDLCIATVSARHVDERKEFLHTQRELKERLVERDALIGTLQHQLKLAESSESTVRCRCCFGRANCAPVQSRATATVSTERFTSRSRSDSGVPTTAAPICHQGLDIATNTQGTDEAKGPRGRSNQHHPATEEVDTYATRASSLAGLACHENVTAVIPKTAIAAGTSEGPVPVTTSGCARARASSLSRSEGRDGSDDPAVRGTVTNSVTVPTDRAPSPHASFPTDCCPRVSQASYRVGVAAAVGGRAKGLRRTPKTTPLRRRRQHVLECSGDTAWRGSLHCRTCREDVLPTAPEVQQGTLTGSSANPLPSSFPSPFVSTATTGARFNHGVPNRAFSQSPSHRKKRRSSNRVRCPVAASGDELLRGLIAKSAFLEAGLRGVMERLDEQQGELHDVTCLLHKLVLSSMHGSA
ncbi:uncharacterized protein TEOVI_000658900 [Trypanosoma equiperdum]|uniref:Uncharacterized protein n=2 Tax=Trypanozoon TaxID=39700 RepID=Q585K3_TRYB2|nr:hypothetical protein, conserved [Trypanosoma brucei brucei TREU927]AAX79202.1 hypothetical protein, conserved [Trypanosoma brucei]AAZ10938.1 hypothetical protein, conserved [Trypanosoma brucei brucei TREU927]SCU64784.1 hypothetical protein, conserved [Trypanosoma equiperdum]